jgi:hypothetical protein
MDLDAGVLDASTEGGDIHLRDLANGLALGSVSTGGDADSSIDLTVVDGPLLRDPSRPELTNLDAGTLDLEVSGGGNDIGAGGDPIVTSADRIDVRTEGGDINLRDTNGDLAIGEVSTGGSTESVVSIRADGGSLVSDPEGTGSIQGGTLLLDAADAVGTPESPLQLDAGTLGLSAGRGNGFVDDRNGDLALVQRPDAPSVIRITSDDFPDGEVRGGDDLDRLRQAETSLVVIDGGADGSGSASGSLAPVIGIDPDRVRSVEDPAVLIRDLVGDRLDEDAVEEAAVEGGATGS